MATGTPEATHQASNNNWPRMLSKDTRPSPLKPMQVIAMGAVSCCPIK